MLHEQQQEVNRQEPAAAQVCGCVVSKPVQHAQVTAVQLQLQLLCWFAALLPCFCSAASAFALPSISTLHIKATWSLPQLFLVHQLNIPTFVPIAHTQVQLQGPRGALVLLGLWTAGDNSLLPCLQCTICHGGSSYN